MTNIWPVNYSSTWDGDTKSWMSQIDERVLLRGLSIPGTHDSISRLGACTHISTTQYGTIEDQLNAGIRFLDLRVKTYGDTGLKMVHGMEDIGGYYDNTGNLTFDVVLQHIYDWLNAHPKETIIIKVVDCDNDGIDKEPSSYDTDNRIYNIWKTIDDASPLKSLQFNKDMSDQFHLTCTLGQVRGKVLLWRVFKEKTVRNLIGGVWESFGLNMYELKKYDDNPYFNVIAPQEQGAGLTVLACQSKYGGHISYAEKMNDVVKLMYETWCSAVNGLWQTPLNYYFLNELNIATSAGQGIDYNRYYPITNATAINPIINYLLDQMLSQNPCFEVTDLRPVSSPGSLGILLFDWADDPSGALRDLEKTRKFNEPIYKKVIQFNFQKSIIWKMDTLKYLPTDDQPYVILQSAGKSANTNPVEV